MKAILVLDKMPNSCEECVVRCDGYTAKEYAQRTLIKPNWCHLKLMPSKRKSMVEWVDANVKSHDITEYDKGWNACVEFIEGENNNG